MVLPKQAKSMFGLVLFMMFIQLLSLVIFINHFYVHFRFKKIWFLLDIKSKAGWVNDANFYLFFVKLKLIVIMQFIAVER